MKTIKELFWIILLLFPITNSYATMVTQIDKRNLNDPVSADKMGTVQFNDDGTKMFLTFHNSSNSGTVAAREDDKINEYTLSVPYDISTATYAGNNERCSVVDPEHSSGNRTTGATLGFHFADNGMKIFTMQRGLNNIKNSFVNRLDLTTAYDISTCTYHSDVNVDTNALQNGTNIGDRSTGNNNNLQGMFITNDGTKMFLTMNERGTGTPQSIKQYSLSTPYDLSTLTLASSTAISLQEHNPFGITFGNSGKRLFVSFKGNDANSFVEQYSLTVAFDISTATSDGQLDLQAIDSDQDDLNDITFNKDGLKMFSVNRNDEIVFEYDLACAFTVIAGKCPSITENKDRTGLAIAQIEIAKRNIDHSTNSALNRLSWIRRNKDKQSLTNLNIDFNFNNQRLASLTEVVRTSAAKKKEKDKDENRGVFYWSEGSIAVGKIGDTNTSSTKKIDTDAITFGADKVTNENGIKGWAFRIGRNNVDVGTAGSNLDTDTYNITYYSTSPIENDTKFLDSIIGFGKLNSDLLTVVDGQRLTAQRSGHQIYGTIRIKDEIKKNNLTFIPSGRFDIGHTILGSYNESGSGGIDVENQHIRTKKIRASVTAVEDVLNEKYKLKRNGKIEYIMDLDQSSKFKYTYTGDSSVTFDDSLSSGALHSINGEMGIDVVLQDNLSVFLIYERNQALGSGHTDKIHIAIGYLPNKETNYAFNIQGSDDLRSEYILSKTINDFELDFKIINEDPFDISDIKQAFFNLRKVF